MRALAIEAYQHRGCLDRARIARCLRRITGIDGRFERLRLRNFTVAAMPHNPIKAAYLLYPIRQVPAIVKLCTACEASEGFLNCLTVKSVKGKSLYFFPYKKIIAYFQKIFPCARY